MQYVDTVRTSGYFARGEKGNHLKSHHCARGVLALVVGFALAVVLPVAGYAGPQDLPSRLIIAADGVSFRNLQGLQQRGEAYTDFFPVSRMISTFPSLSDIAWADIFRTIQPRGYQRYHYSVGGNRIVGGSLTDLGNPLEYEKVMHVAFDSKMHHSFSYMFSMAAARQEAEGMVTGFFNSRGKPTFYIYMMSADTLQHTRGNIDEWLKFLEAKIQEVSARYQKETGKKLEVILLSDHGNNHADHGMRVPIKSILRDKGYSIGTTVRGPKDIVFTSAGILQSIAIFCQPEEARRIVGNIMGVHGVDIVSYVDAKDPNRIWIRSYDSGIAWIQKKPDSTQYAYVNNQGDPLNYLPVIQKLKDAGKIDADGFAEGVDWMEASSDHEYPAAVERIYRGHHVVTMNPARILVSLKDGYENANGFVKVMSKLKSRGGTHGGLGHLSTNGVILSNTVVTKDSTSDRVADQFDFSDLRQYRDEEVGARFIDSRATGFNRLENRAIAVTDHFGPENQVFFNLWDPTVPEFNKIGLKTFLRFVVKKDGFAFLNRKIADVEYDASTLPQTASGGEFRVPISSLISGRVEPGDYWVKVYASRRDAKNNAVVNEERLVLLRFFTDLDGHIVAY